MSELQRLCGDLDALARHIDANVDQLQGVGRTLRHEAEALRAVTTGTRGNAGREAQRVVDALLDSADGCARAAEALGQAAHAGSAYARRNGAGIGGTSSAGVAGGPSGLSGALTGADLSVAGHGAMPASGELAQLADRVLSEAKTAEPVSTATMRRLAAEAGGQLQGLEHRLKSRDSLIRKIKDDADSGGSFREAAEAITDALRYTIQLPDAQYAEDAVQTLDKIRSLGYSTRVKNYWLNEDNPYQGVNVALTDPGGQRLELQFHTEASFTVKEEQLHPLFEQQRVLPKGDPKFAEFDAEMARAAATIPVPPGVEKVR